MQMRDDKEQEKKETLDEKESLMLSERRAKRRARRQRQRVASAQAASDDTVEVSEKTSVKEKTRRRKDALRDREKQARWRIENVAVIGTFFTYLRGVFAEVQKVTWPTVEEARRLTIVVLAVTVVFSIMLGFIDIFYSKWFEEGVKDTTTFLLIGIPFLAIGGSLSWFYILKEEP